MHNIAEIRSDLLSQRILFVLFFKRGERPGVVERKRKKD